MSAALGEPDSVLGVGDDEKLAEDRHASALSQSTARNPPRSTAEEHSPDAPYSASPFARPHSRLLPDQPEGPCEPLGEIVESQVWLRMDTIQVLS